MAAVHGSYTTTDIRNLALAGHAGSGKTSLTEALLTRMGALGQPGRVESGSTVSDFMEEEKAHGHSLHAAVVHGDYCPPGSAHLRHINLIDTPGMGDFLGQAFSALPAVEAVLVVLSAGAGIQPMTRRVIARAAERRQPCILVVNKIDQLYAQGDGPAAVAALVGQLRDTFGAACLPLNAPADNGRKVIDCFFNPHGQSDLGSVEDLHTQIIDQVVEVDEELALAYLDGAEVGKQPLHDAFETALRSGHLMPICFASAAPSHGAGDVGVQELLEVICRLAPSPTEGNPRAFLKGADAEHEFHATHQAEDHALAHVFHVTIDPFVGKLCVMRVHQGTLTKDSQLFIGDPKNGESKKPFRVGHLFKLQGKEHVEVDKALPGDLCAVAKQDAIHFDCVLHEHHDEDALHLRPLDFPAPLVGLAISTPKRGDETKLADALHKLQEEDPCFRVTHDAVTHETVIHGLGELHLRVVLEQLQDRFGLYVESHEPKIAYRETLLGKAEGHHRHKKQTGGAGQFGEVHLRVAPLGRGEGFVFVDKIVGGAIPHQFLPAIEKGVRHAMQAGPLTGSPIQDVRVEVYDGKHHPVDSKEVAFIEAGKRAFLEAFEKARPVVLEPMADIEVTCPEASMGDITGDLAGKRARIHGADMLPGGMATIRATAPLAELGSYASQIKSVTSGQGAFTMEAAGFEPVPGDLQPRLVARLAGADA
ncbi:MAG: elongation factor G [Planctomycetota bacterium]